MRKMILLLMFAASLFAAQVPVYPKDVFIDMLSHNPGLIEKGILKALKKIRAGYVAGFIVKFNEEGDIVIKAITFKGGEI